MKSTKIVRGRGKKKKTTGYIVKNKGGSIVVQGGKGKSGYMGRTGK